MRTFIFSTLSTAVFFVLLAEPCLAGTFYLAPDGSDSAGDGSRERPWRSIRHATDTMPDDGSTIVLLDGLYVGAQSVWRRFEQIVNIRAENAYRARLRSPDDSNRVLYIEQARNVVFRGLEMFGSGATKGMYLIQIQTPKTERIALVDCIIRDSYRNDLIKINNYARNIVVRGCLLLNPNDHGGDELLDINTLTDVTVEDCILLHDYAGSGRQAKNQAYSMVVIKNSGASEEVTRRICLRRNIFLNYEGKVDQCYVLLGEDGKPFTEAREVVIENNLFLHHSPVRFWGTLLLKGGVEDLTFRVNTVVGHPHIQWSGAFAASFIRIGDNPPMRNLRFDNNIWADPTGQMPRFSMSGAQSFAEGSPPVLNNNVYYNAGQPITAKETDVMVPAADPKAIMGDPKLGAGGSELGAGGKLGVGSSELGAGGKLGAGSSELGAGGSLEAGEGEEEKGAAAEKGSGAFSRNGPEGAAQKRLLTPFPEPVLPRWDAEKQQFLSGQTTIRGEFERLVREHAVPGEGSAAIGAADPAHMPKDDILGQPRGKKPTVGAKE